MGFSGGSESELTISDSGKESTCNAGNPGSILGWEDPLEKGMETHSSSLAWRSPWMEESGGLQFMGSYCVRRIS